MIELKTDGIVIDHSSFKFSGGETQVSVVTNFHHADHVGVFAHIHSSDDVMELLLVTDALRRVCPFAKLHLVMPYLPYARQDRVCVEGEALSLKVFCNLINAQNYESVEIWDCHSDVGLALLNNLYHVEQWELIRGIQVRFQDHILVAPDAGALKKTMKIAQKMQRPFVVAEKVRNPVNGEITNTKVHINFEHYQGKKYLMVDDICDGGRTFSKLAKELRKHEASQVDLYVTHGIFSKGFDFCGTDRENPLINNIYVANSFVDDVPSFVTKLRS